MRQKTYPPKWNYRRIVPAIYPVLTKSVEELNTHWCEEGLSGFYLHFRGTRAKSGPIQDKDLAVWLIALANTLDRPVHPIVIAHRNPVDRNDRKEAPKDHFHAILGVPVFPNEHPYDYKKMLKQVNTSWRDGASRVLWCDFDQKPFSPLEYIPGKHEWLNLKQKYFIPRHYLRK